MGWPGTRTPIGRYVEIIKDIGWHISFWIFLLFYAFLAFCTLLMSIHLFHLQIFCISCLSTSDDSGDILPNETDSKVLLKTTKTFTNYSYYNSYPHQLNLLTYCLTFNFWRQYYLPNHQIRCRFVFGISAVSYQHQGTL